MTPYEEAIIEALEAMTVKEARKAIYQGQFDDDSGHGRSFALSWLSIKEAEERDRRDKRILHMAILANVLATIAM
jgi:hypothetical protein